MISKNQTNILNMVLHVSMCFMISLMVSWTDAYTESCDASLLTMKNVTECPTDKESYEKAADMKNCSSISDSCKKRVQYHCVLNSKLNGLVEVCATSIYIFDKVCAKFDENLKGIIRVDGLECQNFSSPCPISYNSTETYKYPGCFDVRLTTVSTLTITSRENLGSTKKSVIPARNDRQKVVPIVFGVLSALALLTVILISFVFLRRRKLLCFKIGENTDRMAEEKKQLVQLPRYREDVPPMTPLNGLNNDIPEADLQVLELPKEVTPVNPAIAEYSTDKNAQVSKEVTPIYPSLPAAAEAEAHKGMNTAGKLQEEQILDGFDSTPNAYPAYKHVQTREKSFEECKVGSIKDRAWDFARDGFYYEGYDLETTCFHCGTQKGDWKKGADIHAEHMSLNQTCEFVKYVQLHILKTK